MSTYILKGMQCTTYLKIILMHLLKFKYSSHSGVFPKKTKTKTKPVAL